MENIALGQEVAEGQILCTMDAGDAEDQLDSANRTLEYADKTRKNAQESYENAQEDYATACGTKRELENLNDAIARRDEQQKKVDALKSKLDGMSQYKPGNGSLGNMPETNTEYYSTKLELDSAQSTLEVYQRNVDSAQEAYDKKAKEGADSDEAKAQKERKRQPGAQAHRIPQQLPMVQRPVEQNGAEQNKRKRAHRTLFQLQTVSPHIPRAAAPALWPFCAPGGRLYVNTFILTGFPCPFKQSAE